MIILPKDTFIIIMYCTIVDGNIDKPVYSLIILVVIITSCID
jgi:hypothetical protein